MNDVDAKIFHGRVKIFLDRFGKGVYDDIWQAAYSPNHPLLHANEVLQQFSSEEPIPLSPDTEEEEENDEVGLSIYLSFQLAS